MWQRGKLIKSDPESAVYSLPNDEAPSDDESESASNLTNGGNGNPSSSAGQGADTSEASLPGANPAQPGE